MSRPYKHCRHKAFDSMARLVSMRSIHETQWVLTSAFNRLNLMNWLAPDLSRGWSFSSHVVARFTVAVFFFPHGSWRTTLLSSALFHVLHSFTYHAR